MATAPSEQRKRALDALERRFAAAKAAPPPPPPPPLQHHSPNPSSSSQQDGETHPLYSDMSEAVHQNLLQGVTLDANRKDLVDKILIDIISKGDDSASAVTGAKKLKKENWVLLDNFLPKDDNSFANARAKSLKSHSKRSNNHMSIKQHRRCGSFHFPKEFHNFERFKPMHAMWKEYISEVVKETGKKTLAERLLSADLHGAFLTVVESKTESHVGVNGIMVRETTETFGIISQDNRFKVVPKAGSVFMLQVDNWKVTLCGDMLSAKEKLKESATQLLIQPLLR